MFAAPKIYLAILDRDDLSVVPHTGEEMAAFHPETNGKIEVEKPGGPLISGSMTMASLSVKERMAVIYRALDLVPMQPGDAPILCMSDDEPNWESPLDPKFSYWAFGQFYLQRGRSPSSVERLLILKNLPS